MALRGIRSSALVVLGTPDPIPLASSAAVAEALESGLGVLDDCGHVPYVEQSEALVRAVRGFIDRTSPTPA
ncbi:MAG: alpha/beta hydrolase [Gemmatimonadaceae bacterium]|nr:alpha/beta hydrolase [Gemmatimonadaceae bacterium]